MNRLRWIGVAFGWLLVSFILAQTQLETDEQTLKSHKLPTDGNGLLDYFVQQSAKEGDDKELPALVRKLGSEVFPIREKAAKDLISRRAAALPYLRSGLTNSPLELRRRAELCILEIESTMQADAIA